MGDDCKPQGSKSEEEGKWGRQLGEKIHSDPLLGWPPFGHKSGWPGHLQIGHMNCRTVWTISLAKRQEDNWSWVPSVPHLSRCSLLGCKGPAWPRFLGSPLGSTCLSGSRRASSGDRRGSKVALSTPWSTFSSRNCWEQCVELENRCPHEVCTRAHNPHLLPLLNLVPQWQWLVLLNSYLIKSPRSLFPKLFGVLIISPQREFHGLSIP